jgi:hypothetical protein
MADEPTPEQHVAPPALASAHSPPSTATKQPEKNARAVFLPLLIGAATIFFCALVLGAALPIPFATAMYTALSAAALAYVVQRFGVDVFCNPPTPSNASLKFTFGCAIASFLIFGAAFLLGAILRSLFCFIFGSK